MRSLKSFALIVGLVLCAPAVALAQDKPAPAAQPKVASAVPEKTAPPKLTNIQVEITITDQLGNTPPTKKTVSLITADWSVGRIRSRANARPNERTGTVLVNLNVDARPQIVAGVDLIQLDLTIEYQPLKTVQDGNTEPAQTSPTELNQSLRVIMTSGKLMVVSQAADPVTDRKIVVEAKATILK